MRKVDTRRAGSGAEKSREFREAPNCFNKQITVDLRGAGTRIEWQHVRTEARSEPHQAETGGSGILPLFVLRSRPVEAVLRARLRA
jgi:hypothetical protein